MQLPKLTELTNEQLIELHASLGELFQTRKTEELSVSGVTELAELTASIESVVAEMRTREKSRSDLANQVNALVERVTTAPEAAELATKDEAPAEPEAEAAELATETEAPAEPAPEVAELMHDDSKTKDDKEEDEDAMTAASLSPVGLNSPDLAKAAAEQSPAVIVAAADIPGVPVGKEMESWSDVAQAFISRRAGFRGVSPSGDGDQVIVASVRGNYPEERVLEESNLQRNMDKIDTVASPTAITASGGLCAPLTPYYGLQVISDASRPVRDSLPQFQADRGGVRFIAPPRLSDVTAAIGVTTAAQDEGPYGNGGGDTPFKPCLHVTCGTEEDVTITAIHRCLTFGNFGARTFPEQVEAWLALTLASHARRAETLLLDAIAAASTATTAAQTYSAVRTLLPQIDQAVAAYRSRNRTSEGIALRVMLPSWARQLIRADLARSYRGDDLDSLMVNDAQIMSWFTARNVNVTWYIDSATGANQVFGAQGAGALTAFPTTVQWFLFVEGSFVFLDGGTLDLGLVRDSTLNSTNDYQIFAETFENVAFYGVESIKVTSTVCPNGVYAPAATASAPC